MSERYVRIAIPRDSYECLRYFGEAQGRSAHAEMRRALIRHAHTVMAEFPSVQAHVRAWIEAVRQARQEEDEVPF